MKVLLADDHALIREGLAELLRKHADIEIVGMAENGREAVRLAALLSPDVAILDIAMPDLNGIEATREIARQSPGVRVVILSMHAGAQHVSLALAAGAQGYLLKQAASRQIVEALRCVHAGRRYLCPEAQSLVTDQIGKATQISPIEHLSARERQVLQLVAEGKSSAQIGGLLHLSAKTVDTYRSRLMQKLGVEDVATLVKFAVLHGLTPLE